MALATPPSGGSAPTRADANGIEFFETKVRPVLAEQCYACHSGKSGKAFGGLKLDSTAALRKGGDRGPLFQADKPAASLLLKAVHHDGLKMPPAGKLPAAQLAVLERWVGMGAPLPEPKPGVSVQDGIDIPAGKRHWAFQPVSVLAAPRVSKPTWPKRKIDAFVLQKLDAAGLPPSPEADRRTLLRRVSLDLTGLPPTYAEVQAFLADRSANAYERVVERLLASPRYGERWGRHWLDVARYAEDNPTSEATNQPPGFPWRYRDWVIGALNADLPYDQFVRRQLAADLLPDTPPAERAALGFLGLAPVYHKEGQLAKDVIETIAADEWDERLDTVTRGFLGLTVACARCHDHKYDPITTKDYYALAGVMASTQLVERPLAPLPDAEAERLANAERDVRNLERDLRRLRRERSQLRGNATQEQRDRADRAVTEAEAKIEKIKKETPGYGAPLGDIVRDAGLWVDGSDPNRTRLDFRPGVPRDLPVFIRGSVTRPGEMVPRRFLSVLSPAEPRPFKNGSGRLELAEAMLTDAAPLTARVIVNRVWGWHFGRPLVDTPSNFGKLGSKPSHPALLDDLTARFIQSGWSLKWLHREIVLSATYRQASTVSPLGQKKDGENRLLGRMNRQRLDVEGWRDSMLKVSGALDEALGGPSGDLEDAANVRRTVYGRVSRQRQADVLRLFDFPDANRHGESRTPTITPTQGLYFLNSPFVRRQAERLAAGVSGKPAAEAVHALYRAVLQREPTASETSLAVQLAQPETGTDAQAGWVTVAQALLVSNEFLFAD